MASRHWKLINFLITGLLRVLVMTVVLLGVSFVHKNVAQWRAHNNGQFRKCEAGDADSLTHTRFQSICGLSNHCRSLHHTLLDIIQLDIGWVRNIFTQDFRCL